MRKYIVHHRKFRELASAGSVGSAMRFMERAKDRKYAKANAIVKPIIMTAGGAVSVATRELLQYIVQARQSENDITLGNLTMYRRDLFGRLSVILIKHAASMTRRQSQCRNVLV